ncbi:MAG TPA: hypothetical protein PKW21_08105 [Rhabdaerophilum sp.]|nr:hypothetical protein [Rhabdaerophilum sp.]
MDGRRAFRAGALLSTLVFTAGFALGSFREIFVRPYLGPDASRLIELPLMIGISWFAASFVVRRGGPAGSRMWLRVGIVAFLLLIVAELGLGEVLFRRGLMSFFRDAMTLPGALSFLAQALLVVMPLWVARKTGHLDEGQRRRSPP